jgi:hypothetical protein
MDQRGEIAARRVNDMGGEPAGPFVPTEHALLPWEKRAHALSDALNKRGLVSTEEKRRGVDDLGKDIYDQLTYYERWVLSMCNVLLGKGLITSEELGRKMAEIAAREKTHGREVCR